MNNKLKALSAFLASSILICAISFPNKSMVSTSSKSSANHYFSSNTTEFYSAPSSRKQLIESVVKLNLEIITPIGIKPHSSATGFSVAYNKKEDISYIITNNHFCESQEKLSIIPSRFYYETFNTILSPYTEYNGKDIYVIATDPGKDLCLMRMDGYVKPVKVAPKDYKVQIMEPVKIIGAPSGIFPVALDTYISGLASRELLPPEMQNGQELLFLSEMIFGGFSGSPVFNRKGQVVGIMFLGFSDENGGLYGSCAIPLEDLHLFLNKYFN